MTREHGGVAIQ